jgi:hypothetical protein
MNKIRTVDFHPVKPVETFHSLESAKKYMESNSNHFDIELVKYKTEYFIINKK